MEEIRTSRIEKSRTAKACNICRRKKVKCDGKRPICSSCSIFKLPCAFQDSGNLPNRSRQAYVEELEQRIKCMDEQLQRLGQHGKSPQQTSEGSAPPRPVSKTIRTRIGRSRAMSSGSLLEGLRPREEASSACQDDPDQPSYVLRAQDGKVRFFGASSGFGVPYSEEGTQARVKRPIQGLENAARRSAVQWPLTDWVPQVLQDSYESRTTQPLPSREVTLDLVAEYLATFNQIIPLVDEATLMKLVKRQFSWNPDQSPSSWALINVVIAFAYRERTKTSPEGNSNWTKSLGHIKNALNVVMDLFLRNADLPAVQGLLGLALYFQGTPNAQALFMLAASAMRLSHSIGLHRNTTSGFTQSEIEERRRTFWIAFILDADISIRVGRPPAQDIEDHNTPLPADVPPDGRGIVTIDGTSINFFRLLAKFAIVQRRIYRHLQTVVATGKPKEIALMSAKACEEALLLWKKTIPDIFQPQNVFASGPQYSREWILRLHLAYHCCYANLRQLPLATPALDNIQSQDGHTAVDKEIADLCLRCLESARSVLVLRPYVDLLGSNFNWGAIYFFAAAAVALLLEIQINPSHHRSSDDIEMSCETIDFLTDVSYEEPGTFVDFILNVCCDLENSARRAIHQARRDTVRQSVPGVENNDIDQGIGLFPDEAIPFPDNNSDPLGLQWSIPPLWNWQDMLVGTPFPPEIARGKTGDPN